MPNQSSLFLYDFSLCSSSMSEPSLKALHAALSSISDGSVSKAARDAGMSATALARLRRGEQLNIRVTTLVKLSQALGKTTDELLGLAPPSGFAKIPTSGAAPGLTSRDEARLRSQLAKIAAVASRAQSLLPRQTDGTEPEE